MTACGGGSSNSSSSNTAPDAAPPSVSEAAGPGVYDSKLAFDTTKYTTITVTLARTSYAEKGEPEDVSPYLGTALEPIALPKTVTGATPAPVAPKSADKTAAVPEKTAPKVAAPKTRPPAFVLANAPKEPLKEMPLPQRARLLSTWIAAHPKPTSARVRHFLFQHAWIVTGASFGWWHGAEALRELIAADRVAERRWGIGKKSELVARRALAEVEARTK